MEQLQFNSIVSFIWGIADDCLRDVYVRGKYRDVILPMTVIRRLDAVLEKNKPEVLAMKTKLDAAGIANQTPALCKASGQSFCNSSPFTLRDLTSRAKQQQLKADFIAYLDGFSPNVQEILDKFKFRNQIDTMADADILSAVIEKFVAPVVNLSPEPLLDDHGEVRMPGLDNHTMGTIFEELIRRFNEENNEEAGEHFTPRDVIELMADLVFMPIAEKIKDATYSCYDGASGTGGMLTVAQKRLNKLAELNGKDVSIHLFGQEVNPETYAITKSDMLISGEGEESEHIGYGSTLSSDQFPTYQFDFMLSNPPYGKSWKTDADKMGGKSEIIDPRFVVNFADNGEYGMIPRSSDGQLLFLLNNIAKMKETTELGSRIAEVHNGSSLFTGDAGSGESNARRYMIERDLVEAIIALPENTFYNTGIGTFIWVLSNRKAPERRGKIQLIDATGMKVALRKNLGKKNCEFSEENRWRIAEMFLNMEESEHSKVFDNAEFGYWLITVERPLRLRVNICEKTLNDYLTATGEQEIHDAVKSVGDNEPDQKYGMNYPVFFELVTQILLRKQVRLTATKLKQLRTFFAVIDENAQPANMIKIKNADANPLYGRLAVSGSNKVFMYERDADLRDTERVPFKYEGGIEAFFANEVKPFVPDAWIDESKTAVGYELSFTKYFYKPVQLRSLDEITADLRALEAETAGLLDGILGETR